MISLNGQPKSDNDRLTYGEAISQGKYSAIEKWSKIGFTPTINATESEVWSKSGVYTFAVTAGTWDVISDNAADGGSVIRGDATGDTITSDSNGTVTSLVDIDVDFLSTSVSEKVEVNDCVILDPHGTTPEWGYVTALSSVVLTVGNGFSQGGTGASRKYAVVDRNAAGKTGAQVVKLEYLDSNYAEKEEIVVMGSTTSVDTINTDYYRVNSFRVISAGSTNKSVGNLSLRVKGGATTYSYILAGFTRARNAQFTVLAGKTVWVTQVNAGFGFVDAAKAQNQYCRIFTKANREPSTGMLTNTIFYPYSEIISVYGQVNLSLEEPTKLLEKTDIKISGIASAAGVASIALRGYITTP